jgi:uncharacterized protein YjiS (DUF1127 family)
MTAIHANNRRATSRNEGLGIFDCMRRRYQRRRDARVLAKLDDRMLRDIGLSRHDIDMMSKS